MEKDIISCNAHAEALELLAIARKDLAESERAYKRRAAVIVSVMKRLRAEMPSPPQYERFPVSVSTKGIGHSVYSDQIKRQEAELARRQERARAKAWGKIKADHAKACKEVELRITALSLEMDELLGEVEAFRLAIKEFANELFPFNPDLLSLNHIDERPSCSGMLWRGTLLHRVAVTRQMNGTTRIEAIRPGLHSAAYDFTPHFDVAVRYARNGSGNESIDRVDPVVIGIRPFGDTHRYIQPANEGEAGNVIVEEELLLGKKAILLNALPSS